MLIPSAVLCLWRASHFMPTVSGSGGWLTKAWMICDPRCWRFTGDEEPLLFMACFGPFLSSAVVWLLVERTRLWRATRPVRGQVSFLLSHPGAWERAARCAFAALNLTSVWLGYRGIEQLKAAKFPPFHETLFDFVGACIPVSERLVVCWNGSRGHTVIWVAALLLAAVAAIPWPRRGLAQFAWHVLALGFAATGLVGLWIWSHAMVNAGDMMGP